MRDYNTEVRNELIRMRENLIRQNDHLYSIALKLRKFIPSQLKKRISNIQVLPDIKDLKREQLAMLRDLSRTENPSGLAFHLGIATGKHEIIQLLLLEDDKILKQGTTEVDTARRE